MTTHDLERALRECLARQALRPPVVDLAEPALRRARRIRRGRRSAAAALVLLVVVTAGGGWRHLHAEGGAPTLAAPSSPATVGADTHPTAAATSPSPPSLMSLELVAADRLHTVAGDRIDLSRLGPVTQARRTTGGWLVVGTARAGRASLWLVPPRGAPRALIAAADAVVLEPDGPRVTWLAAGRVAVATVARGELVQMRDTPLPPRVRPVGFVGEGVLLAGDADGPEPRGRGVWWPTRPGHQATWNRSLTTVYGPLPDGRMVAQVVEGTGRPCLALLAARRGLPVLQRACAVPLATAGVGSVSPDGRWLLAEAAGPAGPDAGRDPARASPGAVLVELGAAFQRRPAVRAAGPRLAGAPVWTDPATVLHPGETAELVQIAAPRPASNAPAAVNRVRVPGLRAGEPVLLVPGPRS